MDFPVTNRFTGAVQFVAAIACDENASVSVKLGLAVKWARKTGADLDGADLYGADLYGANLYGANLGDANLGRANLRDANLDGADLDGANLRDANLLGGIHRSDGYRFWLIKTEAGLFVSAGCRWLNLATEARQHWQHTRGGTPLGAETTIILDCLEALARQKGWLPETAAVAA